MASPTRWTGVWANFRSQWWTGKPCVLQFMGSQRVGHEWATELNIPLYIYTLFCLSIHQLTNIWDASIYRLLWITLLWTRGTSICLGPCFQFFWVYIPQNGITKTCGNFISHFLRDHHPILHPHQQCTGVPLSLHLSPTLLFFFFFWIRATLIGVKQYFL